MVQVSLTKKRAQRFEVYLWILSVLGGIILGVGIAEYNEYLNDQQSAFITDSPEPKACPKDDREISYVIIMPKYKYCVGFGQNQPKPRDI